MRAHSRCGATCIQLCQLPNCKFLPTVGHWSQNFLLFNQFNYFCTAYIQSNSVYHSKQHFFLTNIQFIDRLWEQYIYSLIIPVVCTAISMKLITMAHTSSYNLKLLHRTCSIKLCSEVKYHYIIRSCINFERCFMTLGLPKTSPLQNISFIIWIGWSSCYLLKNLLLLCLDISFPVFVQLDMALGS